MLKEGLLYDSKVLYSLVLNHISLPPSLIDSPLPLSSSGFSLSFDLFSFHAL